MIDPDSPLDLKAEDALAAVIWKASQRDEGTISPESADKIASALRAYLDDRGHLHVDRAIPWTAFLKLLEAMAEAGIVEIGYVVGCRREGFASVRLPWVRKDETAPGLADGEGLF